MKNTNPIIKNASVYVFDLFKEKLSGDHVYHNYPHTLQTVKACKELAAAYDLSSRDLEVLLLAAWFHDTGYTRSYEGHEAHSAAIMKDYLDGEYKLEDIAEIESLILSTRFDSVPDGTLQEILHDADYISIGKKKFTRRAELLRIEWERLLGKRYSAVEWEQEQLNFLLSITFKTEEALTLYGEQREDNIRKQRATLEEVKEAGEKNQLKLEKSGLNKPPKLGRGIETLYRSVYQYHIDLSSLADNKANIMISINTIIVSLIITLFGTGFTFSSQGELGSVRFVFPMAILLLSSLTAVVFAILSARPNITSKEKFELANKQSSVLFFGNFAQLKLQEFVDQINLLKEQNEALYDSMSVDIYHLGSVLVKKYRLLSWSYNIFMGGLVVTGIGFVVIMLISYEVA
ncbi:Pycsar system effector family protein [Hufsiella ginkgonis]|uniref:HD domain-containing protein n=1 Tax=Hufsiella ginkgonis TaxID=2695274 RepID=A0A7K1Y3L4_9SPHI|nr:Pycsar system effector family protein [Hufsiella ginkgonis]MXV17708.1 HD domain-containing protein [Hufsiella ginkgonis]